MDIPKFGIGSLVVGSLGVVLLLSTFRLWWSGQFDFLVFAMILYIVAVTLGVIGIRRDVSKGFAKGGLVIGIIGVITSVVLLCYMAYAIYWHTYIH